MFFVMELDSLWIWGWRVVGSERARDSRRPEARALVNHDGRTEKNDTRAVKCRQKKNARFRCVCTTKVDPGTKIDVAFRYRDSNPSLERERLIC